MEEVIRDPSIFDALEEPMGEGAAEDGAEEATTGGAEGAAAADEEAEAAVEEEATADEAAAEDELDEANADEVAGEEAVAEGDAAASDADEAAAAAAVDEANADEAEATSAEAAGEVDETAADAEEEVAAAGSEEAAVEEDAEEVVTESDDELTPADESDAADETDEEATGDTGDASTADEGDAATTPVGGPDSVLAEFHSAPIPDEYADLVSTVEADEESIARGETTYTTLCASCHGDSGMGDGPAGLALDPPAAPVAQTSHMVSDAYLFWRISEGGTEFGTAMIPWKGSLDEEARWDVINYIRSIDPDAGGQGQGGQGQGGQGQGGQGQGGQGQGGQGQGAGHTAEPLSAADHRWVLDTLYDSQGEPIDLIESDEITASFSDGSLSGVTACSSYAGKYEADDDALSIEVSATSPLADPLEGCGDGDEVDDQEEAYLDALESTASYSAQRGQMELSDENGNVLVSFKAVQVK